MRSYYKNTTEYEIQEVLNEADPDGNGTIDFPVFVSLMTRNELDADGNGTIDFSVFVSLLARKMKDTNTEGGLEGTEASNNNKQLKK